MCHGPAHVAPDTRREKSKIRATVPKLAAAGRSAAGSDAGIQTTIPFVLRQIHRFGSERLHRPATGIDTITPAVQTLIDDMIETMYAAEGIGLAAPQVGVSERIFVADPSGGHDADALIVMVNPAWVSREGMQREEEGCLSVPGFSAAVARPARAVVQGRDRNGSLREVEATGILARAFAHEMDHLDGTLFLDRLSGIRRELLIRKINKLRRGGQW